jgi:hypothetical protein
VAQVRRKERKLAREVGPLRFEMHATHKDVFDFRVACASIRRGWHSVNQWVRRSPYREYLEIPINATRKYRQRLAFRYVRSDSQN